MFYRRKTRRFVTRAVAFACLALAQISFIVAERCFLVGRQRIARHASVETISVWPSMAVLISTYQRPHLLLEALFQIAAQEYPGSVEAIVVDDSNASLEAEIEELKQRKELCLDVRYIYLKDRMPIGAKRNLAASSTHAEVLAVWDDDDVFTIDRLRKQVEHLLGAEKGSVVCSAIEVATIYSVPTATLHMRPDSLPKLVYENTLCFKRAWWEANNFSFGPTWEVSGQGEGTLQPWWTDVTALTGAEEPFLYIYLPSSISGGTSLYIDPHPEPDQLIFALLQAFRTGRFPKLKGPHVGGALAGARRCLCKMLDDPSLFDEGDATATQDFESFRSRYAAAHEKYHNRPSTRV